MPLMRRLLIPVFLVATATAALAQPAQPSAAPTAGDMAAQDCARARKMHKTCVLTFGADPVDGKVPTGDGTSVTALQHGKMPSLIHVREDFRPEIIKAAEDID
jgi:hypothetical protein